MKDYILCINRCVGQKVELTENNSTVNSELKVMGSYSLSIMKALKYREGQVVKLRKEDVVE